MANRLLIQWYDDKEIRVQSIPITNDIQINIGSSFKSASSIHSSMGKMMDIMSIYNAFSGNTNDIQAMFDFQMWEKTSPLELNIEVIFYTKTDPIKDVLSPAVSLMSLTILKNKEGHNYEIPGVSLSTLSAYMKKENKAKEKNFDTNVKVKEKARIVAFRIPGLVRVDKAIVKSAKPTVNKEITESKAPLYIKLDLTLESIYPACDQMFLKETNKIKSSTSAGNINLGSLF